LILHKSVQCDIDMRKPVAVSFSLIDFLAGLKVGKAIGDQVQIFVNDPGSAAVLDLTNRPIHFDCALATMLDLAAGRVDAESAEQESRDSTKAQTDGPEGEPN
jgi:hypothetical protein